MALLLAKNDDFASWRGVEEFSTTYRTEAVRLAAQYDPQGIAQCLEFIEDRLSTVEQENRNRTRAISHQEQLLAQANDHNELRDILTQFYEQAYQHFKQFGSPTAFFELSDSLLKSLAARCLRLARQQIGVPLPPVALFVMGPAGRIETTRYCRIQIGMVWGNNAPDLLMSQLGEELTTWLRACGIPLEEGITPLHELWRGNLDAWQDRFETAARTRDRALTIEILRLIDRTPLICEGDLTQRFNTLCTNHFSQRSMIANLVERCQNLSNGITMLGGFKLEKSGPHRGAFSLLDHAFLPLSSSVTAICLMNNIHTAGTPQRLRSLVKIGKLDVDLAERALQAWHCFSEHRLTLELHGAAGQDCRDILHLNPAHLPHAQQERLKNSLETVADLQRFMSVVFGSYT